jgi:hypothetical protein
VKRRGKIVRLCEKLFYAWSNWAPAHRELRRRREYLGERMREKEGGNREGRREGGRKEGRRERMSTREGGREEERIRVLLCYNLSRCLSAPQIS